MVLNSHDNDGEKCVEIVKTLHVKFSPLGASEPNSIVSVNISVNIVDFSCLLKNKGF